MDITKFKCKNEEIPVIGGYLLFSVKRDLDNFQAFSPKKFDANYVTVLDSTIKAAMDLVNPKEETAELKIITSRLYANIVRVIDCVNSLSIYIKMAKTDIPISAADFGISLLRNKAHRKDAEGVLQNLHLVTNNTVRYREALLAQGLPENFVDELNVLTEAITADNQKQYEIISNRKQLVENNKKLLNDLYAEIMEVCEIGKSLYKSNAPEKVSEYTFKNLLKKVRIKV